MLLDPNYRQLPEPISKKANHIPVIINGFREQFIPMIMNTAGRNSVGTAATLPRKEREHDPDREARKSMIAKGATGENIGETPSRGRRRMRPPKRRTRTISTYFIPVKGDTES
jgi:hypothetical protein